MLTVLIEGETGRADDAQILAALEKVARPTQPLRGCPVIGLCGDHGDIYRAIACQDAVEANAVSMCLQSMGFTSQTIAPHYRAQGYTMIYDKVPARVVPSFRPGSRARRH